jgi:hypothetical protein
LTDWSLCYLMTMYSMQNMTLSIHMCFGNYRVYVIARLLAAE